MTPPEPGAPDPIGRAVARLRAALGLATILMLVLSKTLWVTTDAFPRVPFLKGIPEVPAEASWGVFGLLLVTIAAAAVGLAWRASLGVSLAILGVLVLGDQHRFQPWVYQYAMTALLLATLPNDKALGFVRWWYASLYLHSGLSKLDLSFVEEMGPLFLNTIARLVGLSPSAWPQAWRTAAIVAMPAWEIVVAALLVIPATRRAGVVGAIVLHATLLAVLGPFGLRHSGIVLVWNAAMIVEVVFAFGPRLNSGLLPSAAGVRFGRGVRWLFWAGVLLPFGERSGWLDAWPSHALYASHVERTEVYVLDDESEEWPEEVRRHLGNAGGTPWRRLDLTGWSREVRGVPVYPQGRACNGLAEALAARYGGRRPIRVIQWGRADRWTGRRDRIEVIGLDAIRGQGGRYRLNARPDGGFSRRPERTDEPAPVRGLEGAP